MAAILRPYRTQLEAAWDGQRVAIEAEDQPKLLSVPAAAAVLGCSRWHVYDLVNAGKLARRFGGVKGTTLRLAESDVQAYIDSIKAAPLPAARGTH